LGQPNSAPAPEEPVGAAFKSYLRRLSGPGGGAIERHNYRVVQLDSVAMGVVAAATPFLPVFLARLGGSNFEVGLLTTLPALGGLLFAIPFGQLIQRRRNVVPWYSRSRLIANMGYLTIAGVVLLGAPLAVPLLLLVWALVTIPSTIGQVSFSVVMDAAARPRSRYDLLSRRWAIMGLTTAVAVAVIGFGLERIAFPANYQLAFTAFSLAGVASYHYSRQIRVADHQPVPAATGLGALRQTIVQVRSERPFVRFALRQTVYTAGVRLVAPLIPLYYVRVVHASDAWIGIIATAQSLALLVGYWFWRNQSQARGGRFVLLWSLGMAALQPALLAGLGSVELIAILAGAAAIFSAGADLALFDELMKRVPHRYGITFSAVDYAIVNVAGIGAPLAGALLADAVGIQTALILGASVSLVAFGLFAVDARGAPGGEKGGGDISGHWSSTRGPGRAARPDEGNVTEASRSSSRTLHSDGPVMLIHSYDDGLSAGTGQTPVTTMPRCITREGRSRTRRSARGSPSTRSRSATLPASIVPISDSRPSSRAATLVADLIAAIGDAPCWCTSSASRQTMSGMTPLTPQSVPVAIGIPRRIAVSHERRWATSISDCRRLWRSLRPGRFFQTSVTTSVGTRNAPLSRRTSSAASSARNACSTLATPPRADAMTAAEF